MNLNFLSRIVAMLIYTFLVYGNCCHANAEEAKFELAPYLNGVTSVNDGNIEFGPEISNKQKTFIVRPYLRFYLTDKEDSKAQIDRFTSTWRAAVAMDFVKDNTKEDGPINRFEMGLQGEWGTSEFKYFPDKTKANEKKTDKSSFGLELKGGWFHSEGKTNAAQWGPQVRIRYARDWKEADETGVVVPSTDGSPNTVTNLRLEAPTATPLFSPAIAFLYYPGSNKFGYTPVLYYDLKGKDNSYSPFNGSGRIRMEGWIYYFPLITDVPNVKIGLAPFISYRTHGADKLDSVEYGGIFQVKFASNLIQFF